MIAKYLIVPPEYLNWLRQIEARTLGQKRELFARCQVLLTNEAHRLGYEIRLDELKRGPQQAEYNATHCGHCAGTKREHYRGRADHDFRPIGIRNTLHGDGLAIDGYLRKPGGRVLWSAVHYRGVGEFFETLHPLTYWGGRSAKVGDRLRHDAGHFAITYRGRQ